MCMTSRVTIITVGLAIITTLFAPLYAVDIPGIHRIEYQGEVAFTDNKREVLLVANALDMGGATSGLGADLSIDKVRQNMGDKINGKQPDVIVKTPLQGIYELYYAKQIFYVDGTGRYIFRNGRMVSSKGENLTDSALSHAAQLQAKKNLHYLSQIADNEMLVYPASLEQRAERSVITIFTDVDCPFCSRIHEELDTYTKAGITIKYLFYPRAGRESSAYSSLVSVWCSEDRYAALEKVESGQHIATKRCKHPVDKHLELAKKFRLLGTPAIFLQDGTLLVGYKRPDDLIKLALLHSN